MKKGDIIDVKITGYDFPNKGIGRYEDTKIVVKNVMPEQTVSVRLGKKRSSKTEARKIEITERAPYETEPVCDHFEVCGGCLIQTMPYELQLDYKEKYVKGLLDRVIEDEYEFQNIIPSPKAFEYRNKMEFSFGDEYKEGPLSLGMHMRGKFYEIVKVDTCKLVDDDFTKILSVVLDYFRGNNDTFHHVRSHTGYLRHLVVRKTEKSGEILVNLVTSSQGQLNEEEFKNIILDLDLKGRIKGVLNTINDSLADMVKCDELRVLYGDSHITEELLDLKFDISPLSFFQTNSSGAEKLYSLVRDYVGDTKDKTIFDLYSGTGTIAQVVSPVAKKVIGIELIEEAVEKARENASFNNLENCEFIAGDVLTKVDELEDKPDIIIIDPPRVGIHPKAIKKIIAFNPDTFIYVSCNPKSLLKDIPEFIQAGYIVEKAVAVDMFPQTGHVETVVKLVKN